MLGLTSGTPTWVAQAEPMNSYMVPDYAAIESTNLISTNGGTWKADRTGFVRLSLSAKDNSNSSEFHFNINGVDFPIASYGVQYNVDGANVARLFPVAQGDTVQLLMPNDMFEDANCYFIPPKYVQPPAPIVVEGGDYSLSEQPVMVNDNGTLRQQTWIDGKPIYRRVFELSITAAANVPKIVDLSDDLISDIILTGGSWIGGLDYKIQLSMGKADAFAYIRLTPDNKMVFVSQSDQARTNAPAKVWVEYTKQ